MASRQTVCLVGAGLVNLLAYLAVTLRLPLWRYDGQLQSWSQLLCPDDACPYGRWGTMGGCVAGLVILMAAYLWGWRLLRREGMSGADRVSRARQITWGFTVLFSGTLCWLMPITSDLFNYRMQADQFANRGSNPLLAPALELDGPGKADDRLASTLATAYSSSPSIYGPAWVLISLPAAARLCDGMAGLLYLKGLAFVAFLGGAWFLERTVQGTADVSPGSDASHKPVEALYLFAWNPLVLFMAVGDGHNDIVMMALVLMAFWFLMRESWAMALVALSASVWIKYVSVILVPLFGLYALRRISLEKVRGWQRAFGGGFCLAGISALVLLPFGTPRWVLGWASALPGRLLRPSNWAGTGVGGWATLSGLSCGIMVAGVILFTIVYVTLVRRFVLAEGTFGDLMNANFLVLLLLFLLGAARSQPWHLIWATAVAGLTPKEWAWPVVLGLSAIMLVGQIWVEWGAPGLGVLAVPVF